MSPPPVPGDHHRFLVSNPYQEPGRYKVRFMVHSISSCDEGAVDQHSRVYKTRLTVP